MCEAAKTLTGYPSIDKPWLKYYSEEAINAPLPECTVYQNVWQHNKDHLNDVALEYFGCSLSYGSLFSQIDKYCQALSSCKFTAGERVLIFPINTPEFVCLLLACNKMGIVPSLLDDIITNSGDPKLINPAKANTLFIYEGFFHAYRDAIQKLHLKKIFILDGTESLPIWKKVFAKAAKKRSRDSKWPIVSDLHSFLKNQNPYSSAYEDVCICVRSSGSTGRSKSIALTNRGINATISQYEQMSFHFARHQRFLMMIPIWSSTGAVLSCFLPLTLGVTVICMPKYGLHIFKDYVFTKNIQHTIATPSMWEYTLKHSKNVRRLSNLLNPISGGEALNPGAEEVLNQRLNSLGCNNKIIKGWGLCELGAAAATTNHSVDREGSSGIPLPLVTVAAFDGENKEVPYMEAGELRVLSPSIMKKYDGIQKIESIISTDSYGRKWACTGDIGYIDRDGFVFVLGRSSDSYLDNAGNTYFLFDIEKIVIQHAAVESCKATAQSIAASLPDLPVMHIVLKENFRADSKRIIAEIDAKCRQSLPEQAVPFAYKIHDGFAIKPSGKRDTEALKHELDGFVDSKGEALDLRTLGKQAEQDKK